MKNKRRGLCLLCALLCFTAAMSGCKTSGNASVAYNDNADITDDTKPKDYSLPIGDGETTLVYSGPDSWYAPASLSKNLPVWQEVEKRLGIKIKWEVSPSNQWNTTMFTRIASGRTLPDVMGLPNWHNADIARFADEKIIVPLNGLINEYAPNIKKLLKENGDIRKQMTAPDGRIYSIDEYFEANEFYDTILIRKDWLDKVNLGIPKTIDEFIAVFEAFKKTDLNGNGKNDEIPLSVSEGYRYDYFCSGFGLSTPLQDCALDKDGKVVFQRATPEYRDFLSFLADMYKRGLMDPQYAVGDPSKFESLVVQNVVGVTVGGGDWAARYEAGLKASGVKDADYVLIDPPVDKNGNLQMVKRPSLGGQIGISADCKIPEIAIKFMDYLWATDEGNILLHYGLEGVSYTKNDKGEPVLNDFVMKNPDGLDPGSALRSIGAWPPLFDRQTRDFMSAFFPEDAVQYYADNVAQNKYVEPFPKILPTADEVKEASKILGDINTYQKEMEIMYILGQENISTYDTVYLPKLKELHLDQYVELRQRQYERFKSLQ